jgi:hypothetical protein
MPNKVIFKKQNSICKFMHVRNFSIQFLSYILDGARDHQTGRAQQAGQSSCFLHVKTEKKEMTQSQSDPLEPWSVASLLLPNLKGNRSRKRVPGRCDAYGR